MAHDLHEPSDLGLGLERRRRAGSIAGAARLSGLTRWGRRRYLQTQVGRDRLHDRRHHGVGRIGREGAEHRPRGRRRGRDRIRWSVRVHFKSDNS